MVPAVTDDVGRSPADKVRSLSSAVSLVEAGDEVHIFCGHSRWTAAASELVRQWWGRDPQFTLNMLSLSSLGTLFFRGGLVRKVVTGYSGDVFPNFTPNHIFGDAYLAGEVEVEHWSFLAFSQRLEAAARGLPAMTTLSIAGSSMADNDGFALVESPFGESGGQSGGQIGLVEAHAGCGVAARADRRSPGQRGLPPPVARRRLGCTGGSARRDRHRRAARR